MIDISCWNNFQQLQLTLVVMSISSSIFICFDLLQPGAKTTQSCNQNWTCIGLVEDRFRNFENDVHHLQGDFWKENFVTLQTKKKKLKNLGMPPVEIIVKFPKQVTIHNFFYTTNLFLHYPTNSQAQLSIKNLHCVWPQSPTKRNQAQ